MKNVIKLYVAYKAGYYGTNILETYFALVANIILEKHLTIIEDTVIASEIQDRYQVDLPLLFVRQILGVGVKTGVLLMITVSTVLQSMNCLNIDLMKLILMRSGID